MALITYVSSWKSISERIKSLIKASELHASFLKVNSASPYGADAALQKQCEGIVQEVEVFKRQFEPYLPTTAIEAIARFSSDGGAHINQNNKGDAGLLRSSIVKLAGFESELTYCLDSSAERVRSTSELAFAHLQRLIAVDAAFRTKWLDAFLAHETHCEKLGGVHLLWHGIWAFKVDATGGKTDLVYQEAPRLSEVPAALGMVLTEWKLARRSEEIEGAFADARMQADLYAGGVLAGLELTSHRYLVVVSEKASKIPPDFEGIWRDIQAYIDCR